MSSPALVSTPLGPAAVHADGPVAGARGTLVLGHGAGGGVGSADLVAAHGWDVPGAQKAGLTGAWFPRSERAYPSVYEAPHVLADDLPGAVAALLALPE